MRSEKKEKSRKPHGYWTFWRRERDSNPRVVAHKLISSQPRYDRFDISPYMLSLKSGFDWAEHQDRTTCLFNFSICENPHGRWIFGWTGRPAFGEISSQPRYDRFDTSPYMFNHQIPQTDPCKMRRKDGENAKVIKFLNPRKPL